MKKIFALLFVMLLILSTAACSNQGKPEETKAPEQTEAPDQGNASTADEPAAAVSGGWADAQSIEISSEVKEMFDKLNETLTGAQYEPIVYVSSQVVAGTNHLVLCKSAPTVPGATAFYVLVTVYEDLQGSVEITDTLESDVTAPAPYDPQNPTTGAYGEPTDYAVTEEVKTAVEKADEAASDVSYQPIALLGQQVVGRVLGSPVFRSLVIVLQEDALRANGDVPSISDAFVDVLLLDAERAFADTAVDISAEKRKIG